MVASVFNAFKDAFKACFLTTNISPCWQLIIRPTFCPTYSYIQKSLYIVLFLSRTTWNLSLAPGPIELSHLSLAQGLYENRECIPILSY